MGIDWETILGAEGADMADAYEDMVFDAREKMDKEWRPYGRCVPFPAAKARGVEDFPEAEGLDEGGPAGEACDMAPELGLLPDIYLGSTAGLNAINDRIFNILLSIQGFIVDSGAAAGGGFWKMARDMCAAASFPLELSYGAERSAAEGRLERYRQAQRLARCAATAPPLTAWAAPGRDMAYLEAKLDELDGEIQKYDEALHGE